MRKLIMTVSPQGDTSIKAIGFQGKKCLDATKFLETTLGQATGDKKTPEFYLPSNDATNTSNQEGYQGT